MNDYLLENETGRKRIFKDNPSSLLRRRQLREGGNLEPFVPLSDEADYLHGGPRTGNVLHKKDGSLFGGLRPDGAIDGAPFLGIGHSDSYGLPPVPRIEALEALHRTGSAGDNQTQERKEEKGY
jgi:hypothetical protein